jgi:hypothetical protein
MGAAEKYPRVTFDEYFRLEEASEERHECIGPRQIPEIRS